MFHRRGSRTDSSTWAGCSSIRLTTTLIALLLGLLFFACIRPSRRVYSLSETGVMAGVAELARQHPGEFANSFTFVVLVDRSPCGKLLQETPHWRDWQRSVLDAGWGFVFGTSRADSAGLVWTAKLDSVKAPVLVLPGCEQYLQELGVPRGTLPLKLLIDSTMQVRHLWNPVGDTTASRIMTEQIDSVCRTL